MEAGNESPPLRNTILGSFLRGRPRNSSQSHIVTDVRETSPSPPQPPSPSAAVSGHRRSRAGGAATTVQASTSHQATTANPGLGLSNMLRRRRSAGTIASSGNALGPTPPPAMPPQPQPAGPASVAPSVSASPNPAVSTAHRIRLVPHIDTRRTLRFEAISRDLKEGEPALRIGRFTDRSGLGLAAVNAQGTNRLAFKSKVVSRAHAEIWVEAGGRFFIRDTKSSSGTFLNHVRLSPANTESRPYPMKDGDILQLGVDYQGGAEDIYKSVKIRIELGREWQAQPNAFNTNTLKVLKSLAVAPVPPTKGPASAPPGAAPKASSKASQIPDCCICLFGVTIRQALFIAPCSHTFHYKCIRPLLEAHHPAFSCPLCRTFADLDDDVEVEVEYPDEEDAEGGDDDSVGAGEGRAASADLDAARRRMSVPGTYEDEPEEETDEVMLDAHGGGGVESEGSGSGDNAALRVDSPVLVVGTTDMGEVGEGEVMEVDGTVGAKRKR
ncbi:putative RING-like zinc finger [Lyophyllum shimeji]|uniref:RING-like zinc finger n=1 Tax=Lyophyllum shimeji TaxID=47721 RepID=A0A9P3UPN5_LYOSH|nr:putative RING-like zinc finger [Lyophyllum shimeji]